MPPICPSIASIGVVVLRRVRPIHTLAGRWRLCSGGALLAVLTLAAASHARPPDPAPAASPDAEPPSAVDDRATRSGYVRDLALLVGGGYARVREDFHGEVEPLANAGSFGGDLAYRLGGFTSSHLLISNEILLGLRGTTTPRFEDPTVSHPTEASKLVVVLPLRPSFTYYPSADSGFFFTLAAGVGVVRLPSFAGGKPGWAAGYSLEMGYELSGSVLRSLELALRYNDWVAAETVLTNDHPYSVASRELMLGLRAPL
jgi:hypothetical protein